MEDDARLQGLLGEAADLGDDPIPDVDRIVAQGRRRRARRRASRIGVLAAFALVAVGVVTTPWAEPANSVSTVDDGPGDTHADDPADRRTDDKEGSPGDEPAPTTTETMAPADAAGDGVVPPAATTVPVRRVLIASHGVLPPDDLLTITSAQPCPAGERRVSLVGFGIGGVQDGYRVAGDEVVTDAHGYWTVELDVIFIGGIQNVDWVDAVEEVEFRAYCGRTETPSYEPVRVRLGPVTTVPHLAATWDGTTATFTLDGCSTKPSIHLYAAAAPPPDGQQPIPTKVSWSATPGPTPGSWRGTVELPGYTPEGQGLWAGGICLDSAGVTGIWGFRSVELDAPG